MTTPLIGTPDGVSSPAPPTPAPSHDEITCVKFGSGLTFCYVCDTIIKEGWPCVERIWYHTGGPYTRNNGASSGFCRAGLAPESCHAQCAFRLDADPKARNSACHACKGRTETGRRVVNYIASRSARCSETSPLYWCFRCASSFIERHRALLDGHLGAEQQQQGVAWVRHRPLFCPPGLQLGCGLPPLTPSAKADFLAIFRASSAEAEALAVARHRDLQAAILLAMEEDAALAKAKVGHWRGRANALLGGATALATTGTPMERKARRMRIDSGGSRRDRDGDDAMRARSRSRSHSPAGRSGN
jgi:hypothetical protein